MRRLLAALLLLLTPACAGEQSCFEIPGDGCDGSGGGAGGGGPSSPSYTYSYLSATAGLTISGDDVYLAAIADRDYGSSNAALQIWRLGDADAFADATLMAQLDSVESDPPVIAAAPAQLGLFAGAAFWLIDATAADKPGTAIRLPITQLIWEPVLAFDGQVWIAAWEEVYAGAQLVRIAPDGTLLDDAPILFAPRSADGARAGAYDPRILAVPTGSLRVWRAPDAQAIEAARHAPGGEAIDDAPLHIAGAGRTVIGAAARGGDVLLILSVRDEDDELSLEAALIDTSTGRVTLRPLSDVPAAPIAGENDVTLSAGPDGYLLAWRVIDGIAARRLDVTGAWAGQGALVIPGWTAASIAPAVAPAGGGDFVIVAGNIPDYRGLTMARVRKAQ